MSKISIIIPVYNVESRLEKCLDSVINQTYLDLEIIVVNDGSTDNCLSIINRYARQDSRIIIVDKPNGGLSDARNAGLVPASGEYICFLDGDDWYDKEYVRELYLCMQDGDCDLVCCNYRYAWSNNKSVEKNFLEGLPAELDTDGAIRAFLNQKILGSVVIKMFRKEIIEKYGLSFPKGKLWEDLVFTSEYLYHCCRVKIIHRCLYNYYQGDESISRTNDTLNLLHFMESAQFCVRLNQELRPDFFEKDNQAFLTRAFICIMVYSFKCKDKEIIRVYRSKLREYEPLTGFSLLLPKEKLLLLLYRLSYPLARQAYLNVFKRIA